ncbi:MAG TPA: hypothetical protein VGJ05_18690 [Fimbriiglobus sp.]|jgi:hypothetical protein
MSAGSDPFEAELAAICPLGPSPGLRRRVAGRLGRPAAPRWVWAVVLVGMLAGAGVFAALWWPDPAAPSSPIVPDSPAAVEPDDAVPSLAAYRRALAQSPEALDALLDRSATSGWNTESAQMPVGTYSRSTTTLSLFGDD